MVAMQVEVPEGVYPGDAMNIMVGDQEFTITVPDGVEPGMLMEVDLPVDEGADPGGPSEEPQTEPVIVEVPPGLGPGDAFTVETAWGGVFEIAVPDGVGPGDQIQAILNGRKGTVRSYNPDKDRLVVTIDGMHPDVAVAFRNLKELPPSDAVMHLPDTEPPEAPPAGVHYVGDRVKVERSNGSVSYATIVEYDEVMEVYTVDVGGGVLKYGVEESYITHVDHTGEWAGKHFIGRRVRVPHLGPREADKMGTIRGHSDRSDLYSVHFESGKIVSNLTFDQIKVPFELIKK